MLRNALNYNSNATVEDGTCVYAAPANVIVDIVVDNVEEIADTLGREPALDCGFD